MLSILLLILVLVLIIFLLCEILGAPVFREPWRKVMQIFLLAFMFWWLFSHFGVL